MRSAKPDTKARKLLAAGTDPGAQREIAGCSASHQRRASEGAIRASTYGYFAAARDDRLATKALIERYILGKDVGQAQSERGVLFHIEPTVVFGRSVGMNIGAQGKT